MPLSTVNWWYEQTCRGVLIPTVLSEVADSMVLIVCIRNSLSISRNGFLCSWLSVRNKNCGDDWGPISLGRTDGGYPSPPESHPPRDVPLGFWLVVWISIKEWLSWHRSWFCIAMELRRSRRLRGLVPEESRIQQVCFLCQRDTDINFLTRCKRTSCYGVLMHKSCHRQMVSMLPTCGNCRRRNDDFQRKIVLETDEEMVSGKEHPFAMSEGTIPTTTHVGRELTEYRRDRRYLNTHYQGPLFWQEVPYEADPGIWLTITISWSSSPDCFTDNPCKYMVWWQCLARWQHGIDGPFIGCSCTTLPFRVWCNE